MKRSIRNLLDFKLEKKKRKKEIEKEDTVRCTRCGNFVKKEKATLSLPEELWVCDECFFGYAE